MAPVSSRRYSIPASLIFCVTAEASSGAETGVEHAEIGVVLPSRQPQNRSPTRSTAPESAKFAGAVLSDVQILVGLISCVGSVSSPAVYIGIFMIS